MKEKLQIWKGVLAWQATPLPRMYPGRFLAKSATLHGGYTMHNHPTIRNRGENVCTSSARYLDGVHVVLVSPKNPENIGSVIRTAGNFAVGKVTVVDPRCAYDGDVVSKVACNSPVMDQLCVTATLQEALVHASSRLRTNVIAHCIHVLQMCESYTHLLHNNNNTNAL